MAAAVLWASTLLVQSRPEAADPKDPARPDTSPRVAGAGAAAAVADAALHVRYAEARLRLGKLRLEQAEKLNRATPGLVSETDMRRLRQRVAVLEAQLAATKDHPHGNTLETQRAEAKAMARIAREELAAAATIHRRQPDAVSEHKLRQFELRAEIARLRDELWDDPSFRQSPVDVMQMQIDQLADLLIEAADAADVAPGIGGR